VRDAVQVLLVPVLQARRVRRVPASAAVQAPARMTHVRLVR
jgi:hypothetical protein